MKRCTVDFFKLLIFDQLVLISQFHSKDWGVGGGHFPGVLLGSSLTRQVKLRGKGTSITPTTQIVLQAGLIIMQIRNREIGDEVTAERRGGRTGVETSK